MGELTKVLVMVEREMGVLMRTKKQKREVLSNNTPRDQYALRSIL